MIRRTPWLALLALTAACGSAGTAADDDGNTVATPQATVSGVGRLPDTVPAERLPLVVVTRPVTPEGVFVEFLGSQVDGNRILFVGDSIFAGTAVRYGGEMCAGLVPLGWQVAIEAEAGRFIEFGVRVVERLVPDEPTGEDDDWDVAAVFLGSNYDGNQERYEERLREILDRLAPRPTLLYTVTEYRSTWAQVNEVIERLGEEYANVTVLDWGELAKTPGVLLPDGLHPGNEGEDVLVELTAAALGRAPLDDGACLTSTFTDDSAIGQGNGTPNTSNVSTGGSGTGSTGSGSSRTTTTTVAPGRTTTTTTAGGGGGGGGGGTTTTTTGGGGGGTTSPPTTAPATTAPPTTSAPTTEPPATPPPPTSGP